MSRMSERRSGSNHRNSERSLENPWSILFGKNKIAYRSRRGRTRSNLTKIEQCAIIPPALVNPISSSSAWSRPAARYSVLLIHDHSRWKLILAGTADSGSFKSLCLLGNCNLLQFTTSYLQNCSLQPPERCAIWVIFGVFVLQ